METSKQVLLPGTKVRSKSNVYTIEEVLGQGSFGITYRASTLMNGELGRVKVQVALKEFFAKELDTRSGDGTVSTRTVNGIAYKYAKAFQRESENLSKIDHPGIVHVLESFEANGTYYYSMEYLPGGTLHAKVDGVGMPEAEALDLIWKIGKAVSFMHERKMMHLDLKPKNIVMQEDGWPVVIDFGLSKQYGDSGEPESSSTIGLGTPGYAPIEQANQSSGRSFQPTLDVYALGATLYKMLTGETCPVASSILEDGFPEEELIAKHVSDRTIQAIKKAMSPSRKSRPQDVDAFLKLLGEDESTIVVTPDPVPAPAPAPAPTPTRNTIPDLVTGPLSGPVPGSDPFRLAVQPTRKSMHWLWWLLGGLAAAVVLFLVFRGARSDTADRYLTAAYKGNAEAQYKLAECYYNGRGVDIDYASAGTWYRKSAEAGYAPAQYSLGNLLYIGLGVDEDETEAVKWFQKAAEQGHVEAQSNLGECFYYGRGVTRDYSAALKWFRKAAEQGNDYAQYHVGQCYYYGHSVDRDYAEALDWYRKSADQGNAEAQFSVGYCYEHGQGVVEDDSQAVVWYRKAVEQGQADAQNSLGSCYRRGSGIPQDYDEAVRLFRLSADQGNAYAQKNLGDCYYFGWGVEEDNEKALEWFSKAADQGLASAQDKIGECYYYGYGVEQNYSEAVKWYQRAAEAGFAAAQASLGLCYYYAYGVKTNYKEAVKWLQSAANQGNSGAQNQLGVCYYNGEGVSVNYPEALRLFREAAAQGDSVAQRNVGICYEYGSGVARDYAEAKRWYEMAKENGHSDIQEDLDRLAGKM